MARIVISGASGLIGSALVPSFESHGYAVTRLVRRPAQSAHELQWDPMRAILPQLVAGFDAVIHLSGENVAGRWTQAKKRRIRDSRVVSTGNLARALASSEWKPVLFICASAIGYYGDRGDEILYEENASGDGFLAEVCREWESATLPAGEAGIRTVNLRTGIVLSREGGALKQMLLPFRLGLGGRIGSGRQWWSWIHMTDFVAAVHHILQDTFGGPTATVERRASPPRQPSGPINMVSPNPVTNAEFTRVLAEAVKRAASLPVPALVARLMIGEFANDGLLASARVLPNKLVASGFQFQHPELGLALRQAI